MTVGSGGQVAGLVVMLLPVESTVVVVNRQIGVQFTSVLVAPVTVAVKVVEMPRMRLVPLRELIVTLITLAVEPLPPQPLAKRRQMTASPVPRTFKTARNLVPTISPTHWCPADLPPASVIFFALKNPSTNLCPSLVLTLRRCG